MNSDQNKSTSNPSQAPNKAASGSGNLMGNKGLQGKGVQQPSSQQPAKSTGSDKDSSKDVKKS